MAEENIRSRGVVVRFNKQKGYGFIKPDDGGDNLFVHHTEIKSDGYRTLYEGQTVEFLVELNNSKTKVVDVTSVNKVRSGGGRGGARGGTAYGFGSGRGGRLRDSLLPKEEPKLAVPLLLLIAQHRSAVVINADGPHIKMVSEQFDRCHGALIQYVEFLSSAVTPTSAYAQLIPSLDDLIHLYHLDLEAAFLIYRPVMRLFRCQGSSEVFWPLHCNEIVNTSIAEKDFAAVDSSSKLVLDLGSSRKPIMWSALLDTARTMLLAKKTVPKLYGVSKTSI